MAFVPKDPEVTETIGSYTLNINDFVVKGIVQYQAPIGTTPAAIYVEIYNNSDLKKAAAQVLNLDLANVSVDGYGSGDVCGLSIMDQAGR